MNKRATKTPLACYGAHYIVDDNGAWFVKVADIPGPHSHGRTIAAARKNIREAIALVLDLNDDASFDLTETFDIPNREQLDTVIEYVMRVPVHTLDGSAGYMAALDGYQQKFAPGTEFSYCNSGYVLLATLLERATGMPYSKVIADKVTGPAGMTRTEFLRMDTLPGDAAVGYLFAEGLRTNVLHLPVVGFGDGGAFTTVADVHNLWSALLDGRLGHQALTTMTTLPVPDASYGMGMWLDKNPGQLTMEGMDAGVSFRSTRFADGSTFSVLSNTSDGAWPMAKHLAALVGDNA